MKNPRIRVGGIIGASTISKSGVWTINDVWVNVNGIRALRSWKWVKVSGPRQFATTKYYLEVAEMEVKLGSGGTDLCTGGTAYADSYLSSTYEPSKAFDNSTSTHWSSVSSTTVQTSWLAYYKSSGMTFDRIRLLSRSSMPELGIRNGVLSVSNDSTNGSDGTWTTLLTGINMSSSVSTWTEHVIT